ncbi:acyl-CoA dehydrogenase family protein [Streptomyces sp. NBC_00872]|uniref:acyl-CoA dehydrogenase family protein n=1 Tax=Streptomyces sp. NBC_00872 TaxID=2903686 RepID=UPI00386822A4|nr:acyl-CoA dehydrogenase family protein [Streptomyces sp. NBC_00872]
MDLRLDPLQERLRDAVDAVLTRTGELSAQLATIGVPTLSAPERFGGLALGLSADIVVNDRLGYALAPSGGYRETVFALDMLDSDDVRTEHLAEIIADVHKGTRQAVPVGAHLPVGVRVKSGRRLWGESEPLPRGDIGLCVVRAVDDDGGSGWYLVLPEAGTCSVESIDHFGTPAARLRFDGAVAEPLPVSADHGERALAAARLRQAALLLGMADRILDVARAHVNTRTQSGKPLVERQTVAHRLALLKGQADGWRLLLHKAAWEFDCDERPSAAAVLAVTAEHAQVASRTALQLHGVRGMLAHSMAANGYRMISVESVRLGSPIDLWTEAASAA